jgi:Protein of unknown function (DUF1800)
MSATAPALVAHVLRRCAIAPDAARVARFVEGASNPQAAAGAAIEWALATPAQPILPKRVGQDDWDPILTGWTDNLRSPGAGLHERMTWFWHGHFTTSSEKIGQLPMLHAQQQLLRTHALGNFAAMLRAVTQDPAMMFFLDLAGSTAQAPNENFARELMELFTMGSGTYTEDDVKAGALALAGWNVDYETAKITRSPEQSLGGEVVFLGRRGKLGVEEVLDTILAHEATAPHVVSKMWAHLVGGRPSPNRLRDLASSFRSSGYEIRPVVEEIVRSEEFLASRLSRPKFPIEWWVSAVLAMGPVRDGEDTNLNPWVLNELGQLPHRPPNVAGWPISPRWLSADQQLTRAAYIRSISWRMRPLAVSSGGDLVEATLQRCSLHEVSDRTRTVLRDAARAVAGQADELTISRRLLTTAVCSPEFALA